MMEELRNKAIEILKNGGWLTAITKGERTVSVYSDGYYCSSLDRFDPEFITKDINDAVDYLYPQW